jgi:hypothetical protein
MSLIPTTVTTRESRAMPLQSGDRMEEFGNRRQCEAATCRVVLSRYNPSSRCTLHRGWSAASAPRRRRR